MCIFAPSLPGPPRDIAPPCDRVHSDVSTSLSISSPFTLMSSDISLRLERRRGDTQRDTLRLGRVVKAAPPQSAYAADSHARTRFLVSTAPLAWVGLGGVERSHRTVASDKEGTSRWVSEAAHGEWPRPP